MKKITVLLAIIAVLSLTACSGGGGGGGGTPPLASDPSSTAPVATPKGDPVGTAVTGTIGAAGGSLTSLDSKLTISIPAGALSTDTVISIQPITNNAPGAKGVGYRILPDGLTFLTPVSLVLSYTDEELGSGGADAFDIAFQTADGYWQLADTITVDTVNKTVTATTTHFCDWGSIERFRLVPSYSTVGVSRTLKLSVQECWTVEGERNTITLEKPVIGHNWQTYDPYKASWIKDWAVNGIHGGNSTVGTINYGTYTAPATKPNPDTVSVSVHIYRDLRVYQVNASIKIDDTPEYFGNMRFTFKNSDANETRTITGWLDLTVIRDYNSDVASSYTLTTPAKVTYTSFEKIAGLKTCTMIQQVTFYEKNLSSFTLFVQRYFHFYVFTGHLPAQITTRCVDNSYDPPRITIETDTADVPLMTMTGPGDQGQKNLVDETTLAESSTYSDSKTNITLTWGLSRWDL